jgi:hypothetical protein
MDPFALPTIKTLKLRSDFLVKTQATGLSNPNLDCGSVDCDSTGAEDASLTVTWNDNAGSNLAGYTVQVIIEGNTFDLTSSTAGCTLAESPAGFYSIQCTGLLLATDACCPDEADFELISITDPDGNTLAVTGEVCTFLDPACAA